MMKNFKFFNKVSTKIALSFTFTFLLILLVINLLIVFSIKSHTNTFERSILLSRRDIAVEEVKNVLDETTHLGDKEMYAIIKNISSNKDGIFINFKFPRRVYKSIDNIHLPYSVDIDRIGEYQFIASSADGAEKKSVDGHRYYYLNTYITADDGNRIYIQLISDLKHSDTLFGALVSTMILVDAIGLFLALISGLFFAKKTLKPIASIADTAEMINQHNLNKRIESLDTNDEMGRLVRIINRMIGRLESSFENQTRFISDASHELRTPLAVINGYVDLLNQWGTKNEKLTGEALTSIKEEVYTMTDLIEKLLFIAREENTRSQLKLKEVNIKTLLTKIHKDFEMIDLAHTHVLLEMDDFSATIDEKLILQAIRAITENAVKYTPDNEDRKIILSCTKSEKSFNISIRDEGIGIPEEHVPNLFGRFYRVDEARTKDTGGNGLGLSIVKSIIDMHNGQILIDSEVNVGTNITFKLPI